MSDREPSRNSITSSENASTTTSESGSSDESDASSDEVSTVDTGTAQPPVTTTSSHPRLRAGTGQLNISYKKLLNAAIEEAAADFDHDAEPLAASQIGASYWTSREEESFFSALAEFGPSDIHALANVVKTKSESEVNAYVLLLQNHSTSSEFSSSSTEGLATTVPPAAFDVAHSVEEALNLEAEVLSRHVARHDARLEKKKFGKLWLIHDGVNLQLDAEVEGPDEASSSEAKQTAEDDVGLLQQDRGTGPGKDRNPVVTTPLSSTGLLLPQNFLELSRCLLMNGGVSTGDHWQDIGASDPISSRPAIFRSAFDEFHHIATSLTRKLVQAALLQATSRLRANDTWRLPTPQVSAGDVRIAVELLGFGWEWDRYWATAARRLGLEVYSPSQKFSDRTPRTKLGYQLSFEEVESELGFSTEQSQDDLNEEDSKMGDAHTTLRKKSTAPQSPPHAINDTAIDAGSEHSSVESVFDHRKEAANAEQSDLSSEEEEQDSLLEILDKNASQVEEQRLKAALGPIEQLVEAKAGDSDLSKLKKRKAQGDGSQWRKRTKWRMEWEEYPGLARTRCFETTKVASKIRKHRGKNKGEGVAAPEESDGVLRQTKEETHTPHPATDSDEYNDRGSPESDQE